MFDQTKLKQVQDYLKVVTDESRVYIGCDSSRYQDKQKVWHASYTTVVVVHLVNEDGIGKGCKVFAQTEKMPDYDQNHSKPILRMMNEAYKTAEVYQQLEDDLINREVEVHLDINKDPKHGSHCAHGSAVGYLKGVTGRVVKTKPDAWASSHVADHGVRGKFGKITSHAQTA